MTVDVRLCNFYDLLLSELLQFVLKLHTGDKNMGCRKHILELMGKHTSNTSWTEYKKAYELLENISSELKSILLTAIACNMDYTSHVTMRETKKFMSHEDYVETLEKMNDFHCNESKMNDNICQCDSCCLNS